MVEQKATRERTKMGSDQMEKQAENIETEKTERRHGRQETKEGTKGRKEGVEGKQAGGKGMERKQGKGNEGE